MTDVRLPPFKGIGFARLVAGKSRENCAFRHRGTRIRLASDGANQYPGGSSLAEVQRLRGALFVNYANLPSCTLARVETTYNLIRPPFGTLRFAEMTKKELREYDRWFHDVLPQRIGELEKAMNSSAGFEGWKPSYTPGSLDSLGNWFASQVETRPHTPDELKNIPPHIRDWVSGGELTDRTISLAMDVGMYFSQVFLRNNSSLKWDQIFGSKRFVDYGEPVLVGFGKVPFNPVRMMLTLAYGLASNTKDGQRLRGIYDIWSKKSADNC
jgi:hypothetical protein